MISPKPGSFRSTTSIVTSGTMSFRAGPAPPSVSTSGHFSSSHRRMIAVAICFFSFATVIGTNSVGFMKIEAIARSISLMKVSLKVADRFGSPPKLTYPIFMCRSFFTNCGPLNTLKFNLWQARSRATSVAPAPLRACTPTLPPQACCGGRLFPARQSYAHVPWSGDVRMIGRPSVTFTPVSKATSLKGISPWSW